MTFLIHCPNCGDRDVNEFRFGGEMNPRPSSPVTISEDEWTRFVYMRKNKAGVQVEYWYHRYGCGTWFVAERNTQTN